jgi:hypothetical protein
MAGTNSRIHGYNVVYRNEKGLNFYSFNVEKNGPSKFINQKVNIVKSQDNIYDHQGHIVPQGMLNLILDPLMNEMAKCKDDQAIKDFIEKKKDTYPWLKLIYDYGFYIKAPMFDFTQSDSEDKVGNFFAIVTWNPVNICRAPEDSSRKNYPADKIDEQVADYLGNPAHKSAQGVNATWLTSLQALITETNKNNKNINDFINAYVNECCKTLPGQQKSGIGYYSFPWKKDSKGVLFPDN